MYTLITGACGGLGRAFATILAGKKQPLYLTGRSAERLAALKSELLAKDPSLDIKTRPCDFTDESSRRAFYSAMREEKIILHRLIYAAGADVQKRFEKYTEEKLTFQSRVNFEGAVSAMRAFLDFARLDGTSEILCIGSVSGLYPMPYFALYSAAKRALSQFCSALRVELKGRAKVTCVLPGAMPTRPDVVENIKTQGLWGRLAAMPPEKAAEKCLKAVKRNRRTPVIGFWNKLMHAVTAVMPMGVKLKYIAKRWSKTEKDAF